MLALILASLVLNFAHPSAMASEFKASRIACDPKGPCPEWIAQIATVLTENKALACTATLVAPDLIATNAHCLPQKLRIQGASCQGTTDFAFPASGTFPETIVGCDHVVQVRTQASNEPQPKLPDDFILLKISGPALSRAVLPLSGQGFRDHEAIEIVRVDQPEKKEDIAWVRSEKCEMRYGTLALPKARSPGDEVASIVGCKIQEGNSGSPVIVDGKMRGLIADFLHDATPEEIQKDKDQYHLKLNLAQFGFAYAINLACVAPEPGWPTIPLSLACQSGIADSSVNVEAMLAELMNDRSIYQRAQNNLVKNNTIAFDWTLVPGVAKGNLFIFYGIPKCSEDLDELTADQWNLDIAKPIFTIFQIDVDPRTYQLHLSPAVQSSEVMGHLKIKPHQLGHQYIADYQIDVTEKGFDFHPHGVMHSCSVSH